MEQAQAADRISEAVREVILRQAGDGFVGLIVQGSAVKGGFIEGCSDIDYILYMDDSAFDEAKKLPVDRCIAIHRELAAVDVRPFRYIQFSVLSPEQNGYVGPVPGSYRLLAGRLPVPEATDDELYADAVRSLRDLQPDRAFDPHALLDHGEGRIERCSRLMCTKLWPIAYQLLTVVHRNGVAIWNLKKQDVVSKLAAIPAVASEITSFYRSVQAYYPREQSVEGALAVIRDGIAFIYAAKSYWMTLHS